MIKKKQANKLLEDIQRIALVDRAVNALQKIREEASETLGKDLMEMIDGKNEED